MFGSHPPQNSRSENFWYYVKLEVGKHLFGWLAGPMIGINTHFLNRTSACWSDITHGKLKCYCKAMKLEAVWKGYVPLVDFDGVQCFTIIGEAYEPVLRAIPFGTPVCVTKLKQRGTPLRVARSDWTDAPIPSSGPTRKPADLREFLLRLWNDETLTAFFAREVNQISDHVTEAQVHGLGHAARKQATNRVAKGQDVPETLDAALRSLPPLNGKGRH